MPCWVGTSWKMNKTLTEAVAFARTLAKYVPGIDDNIQPFVIPPFTAARQVAAELAQTRVKVGAQNMHWADAGAWTGEISAPMLTDCGLDLVELGHSERREHFGETDEVIGLKTASAIRHGLVPLVCVGETLKERDRGEADVVLARQTAAALSRLSAEELKGPVLFAYEPVWAIGEGGTPASSEYANEQHGVIKEIIRSFTHTAHIQSAQQPEPVVLYGGSVNPSNAADLLSQSDIDGLFIGRAAWDPNDYVNILRLAQQTVARPPHTQQTVAQQTDAQHTNRSQ